MPKCHSIGCLQLAQISISAELSKKPPHMALWPEKEGSHYDKSPWPQEVAVLRDRRHRSSKGENHTLCQARDLGC